MKLLRVFTSLAACLLIVSVVSFAQPPTPCSPCVTFCSFTQGGWGTTCEGGNPGCIRDECFTDIYPSGVTVGRGYPNGGFWIHLTTSVAVDSFLPQGSTPEALTQNYTDPGPGNITVFAGQVLALQLNVDYGSFGCHGMVDISGLEIASGPFAMWTIQELLDAANIALGGGPLPPGVTIGELNDACDSVNQNFDDCLNNNGYVIIPPQGATVVARDFGQELPVSFCLDFTEQCNSICIEWWCPFCQPGDFAHFFACPEGEGPCPVDCNHLGSVDFSDQVIIGPDPSGNGCWWYATAHSDVPGCYCISFDFQLAADLISFTATPGNHQVSLNWSTASERDNARFDIQRSANGGAWTTVGNVAGQGTVVTTTQYSYVDPDLTNDVQYQYKLISVDVNNNSVPVGNIASATPTVSAAAPMEFALHQNYPNPFNPSTRIKFDIPENSYVTLKVYDPVGRQVAALVDANLPAATYDVTFNADNLPSGMYFYRLKAGSFTAAQKMLLIK